MRENILLAFGQLILFFLTGSLDFQQAPGHRSRGLTTSHVWDCQKLPQKSPPQRACGNCWGGRARSSQEPHRAPRQAGGPWRYLLGRAGPKPLPFLQLPARTFPSITGLLQKEWTGTGLRSQTGKEQRERKWSKIVLSFQKRACARFCTLSQSSLFFPEHPSWKGSLGTLTPVTAHLQSPPRSGAAVGLNPLFFSWLLSDTAGSSIKAHFPLI